MTMTYHEATLLAEELGVPVQPLANTLPAEGLVQVGDDWRYSEWAEGGFVVRMRTWRTPWTTAASLTARRARPAHYYSGSES